MNIRETVHRACFAIIATAPLFFASSVWAADTDSTVAVEIDRSALRLRQLHLLEAAGQEAANSRTDSVFVQAADGVTEALVWDSARDRALADEIVREMTKQGFTVQEGPARSFWIDLTAEAMKSFDAKRRERDVRTLEGFVDSFKSLPPDIAVSADPYGAILQTNNPAYAKALSGYMFVVEPLTTTSWHVSLSPSFFPPSWSAEARKVEIGRVAQTLRMLLGRPTDLEVFGVYSDSESGVHFFVRDTAENQAFIDALRKGVAAKPVFVLREFTARDFHIGRPDVRSLAPQHDPSQSPNVPSDADDGAMGTLDAIISPPADVRIENDGVRIEAKDASQAAELASIVRGALSSRADIAITTLPDASLRLVTSPGAPSIPVPPADEFLKDVAARVAAARVAPVSIVPVGSDRARVTFASADDAGRFRAAMTKPSGLSIQMVVECSAAGAEKFKRPSGEAICVAPEEIISGDMVAGANAAYDQNSGQPVVDFRLTEEGAARFAVASRRSAGRFFAIIVDGVAISAPRVNEPITGGAGQITGGFTTDTAAALALRIVPQDRGLPLRIVETGGDANASSP